MFTYLIRFFKLFSLDMQQTNKLLWFVAPDLSDFI